MIVENPLYKLARSSEWQILYGRAKELNGIQLFYNKTDFSRIQITFLQLLEIFSSLYLDLAMNEELISEEVINDQIRRESYLLYKRKKREEQKTEKKKPDKPFTDRILFRPSFKKK